MFILTKITSDLSRSLKLKVCLKRQVLQPTLKENKLGKSTLLSAVASQTAGRLYGLSVLAPGINHNKNNVTRFIILAKEKIYTKDAGRISICFELPHKIGTLYNMLGNFIYCGVNMVMIESRPILGRNWEYRFFVDIEGNLGDSRVQNALHSIAEEALHVRILGNY